MLDGSLRNQSLDERIRLYVFDHKYRVSGYRVLHMYAYPNGAREKIIKPLRPVDAFFVSQWDDGSVYVSPCKVNLETKEILEIVTVPYIGRGNLYSEHLVLHGQEYSVSKDEGTAEDGQYWY